VEYKDLLVLTLKGSVEDEGLFGFGSSIKLPFRQSLQWWS